MSSGGDVTTSRSTEEGLDAPLLLLGVPMQADGTVDSTVTVSWEATSELLRLLEGYENPCVLIVVRSQVTQPGTGQRIWEQMQSYLVDLRAREHLVAFTRPGNGEVRAIVVDCPDDRVRRLIEKARRLFVDGADGEVVFEFGAWDSLQCIVPSQISVGCRVPQVLPLQWHGKYRRPSTRWS